MTVCHYSTTVWVGFRHRKHTRGARRAVTTITTTVSCCSHINSSPKIKPVVIGHTPVTGSGRTTSGKRTRNRARIITEAPTYDAYHLRQEKYTIRIYDLRQEKIKGESALRMHQDTYVHCTSCNRNGGDGIHTKRKNKMKQTEKERVKHKFVCQRIRKGACRKSRLADSQTRSQPGRGKGGGPEKINNIERFEWVHSQFCC